MCTLYCIACYTCSPMSTICTYRGQSHDGSFFTPQEKSTISLAYGFNFFLKLKSSGVSYTNSRVGMCSNLALLLYTYYNRG